MSYLITAPPIPPKQLPSFIGIIHAYSKPIIRVLMNTCTKLSDPEMVKLIKTKSRAGAEALFDQYAPVLHLAIIRIVCHKIPADIVLEKTFVQIWTTIDLYNEQEKPLLSWMLTIAKKAALTKQKPEVVYTIYKHDGSVAGKVNQKVLPFPGSLSTPILP